MATNEEWEAAVRRSYKASVTTDEYEAKATSDAVTKVAYYMRGWADDTSLFDDTSDEEPNRTVQLLFDFLAYTDGISITYMRFGDDEPHNGGVKEWNHP